MIINITTILYADLMLFVEKSPLANISCEYLSYGRTETNE